MRLIFLFLLLSHSVFSSAEILRGTALNEKKEVVYEEKHEIKLDEAGLLDSVKVEYSKPGGAVFATMLSDFSKNKLVPETDFQDQRFKTKHTLKINDNKVIFEYYKNDKKISSKSMALEKDMVASQGFDNFIRLNFIKLTETEVPFKIGVLSEMDFFSLKGYSKKTEDSKNIQYRIKAKSWIIRMFFEELVVDYQKDSKKLVSYFGRSNIVDELGKPQNVLIKYKWEKGDEEL